VTHTHGQAGVRVPVLIIRTLLLNLNRPLDRDRQRWKGKGGDEEKDEPSVSLEDCVNSSHAAAGKGRIVEDGEVNTVQKMHLKKLTLTVKDPMLVRGDDRRCVEGEIPHLVTEDGNQKSEKPDVFFPYHSHPSSLLVFVL